MKIYTEKKSVICRKDKRRNVYGNVWPCLIMHYNVYRYQSVRHYIIERTVVNPSNFLTEKIENF